MNDIEKYYQLLNVSPDASLKVVKKAYRDLVKKWHPDQFGDDPVKRGEAEEKLKNINLAFERIQKAGPRKPVVHPPSEPGPSAAQRPRRKHRPTTGYKTNPRQTPRARPAAAAGGPSQTRRPSPPKETHAAKKATPSPARKDLRPWQFGFAIAVVVVCGWLGLTFLGPSPKQPSRSERVAPPEGRVVRPERLPDFGGTPVPQLKNPQPPATRQVSATPSVADSAVVPPPPRTEVSERPRFVRGSSEGRALSQSLFGPTEEGSDSAVNQSAISDRAEIQPVLSGLPSGSDALGDGKELITASLRRKIERPPLEPEKRAATPEEIAEGNYQRGLDFANGRGVARDFAEAARWYRMSAEAGHLDAQKSLGMLYATGKGVQEDEVEAAKWLGRAASEGNSSASLVNGILALSSKNAPKAVQTNVVPGTPGASLATKGHSALYEELMNRGHKAGRDVAPEPPPVEMPLPLDPASLFEKGLRHASGDGVEQSLSESAKWYRLAAEAGHVEAQKKLGFLYATGRGVDQDYAEAEKWFRKAAENGAIGAVLSKAGDTPSESDDSDPEEPVLEKGQDAVGKKE